MPRSRSLRSEIILLLVLFSPPLRKAWAGVPEVQQVTWWTTHALARVRPDDPPPRKPEPSVELFAARNEFESFQIVLKTQKEDLEGVNVDALDLTGPQGSRIAQQNIMLYQERYITLKRPSSIEGQAGEWPDPLVPRVDRYECEKRNAFPFRLVKGRNQPIWVELYIPLETIPGNYDGKIRISAHASEIIIPFALHVWSFALPSTSSLKNSFGFAATTALKQHRGSYTSEDELYQFTFRYAKAALWHRISFHGGTFIPPPANIGKVDWRRYDQEVGPFLDGTVFSKTDPLPGAKATSIDLRTSSKADSPEKKVLYWKEWVNHFVKKGWIDRLFYYVWDEPTSKDFPSLAERAALAHRADSRLHNLVTTSQRDSLKEVIDVWVPLLNCLDSKPGFSPFCETTVTRDAYDRALSSGKTLWWYQSCASHGCNMVGGAYFKGWPSYVVDSVPVAGRIMPWLAWKYKIAGELYYSVNEAYSRPLDPWDDIYMHGGNGDGTLFYPGRPEQIGGQTHIPIESVRLKIIRDGLEDYEYLVLLASLGLAGEADRAVSRMTTKVYQWEHNPEVLYQVRLELGKTLNDATLVAETQRNMRAVSAPSAPLR